MQAGLVTRPKRAHFEATESGKSQLAENPAAIDLKLLARYSSFVEKVLNPKTEPEKSCST